MSDPEVLEASPSEVSAVADLARQAAGTHEPIKLVEGDTGQVPVRAWVLHDTQKLHFEPLERYGYAPARCRGEARTAEPDSFIGYVKRLGLPATTTVWVDQHSPTAPPRVTAVINDHTDDPELPGWRDHRVTLSLRATPLWAHWVGRSGELGSQLAFAEHVEDGLPAIVAPSAADMLEIAQTFHAARQVEFSSGHRIASGEVQLHWHEETQTSAGRNQSLDVPERFTLMLEPWPGAGGGYEVQARLRYRIVQGKLQIGYRLDRVDEVMRLAVADLRAHLVEQLPDFPVLAGSAPDPVAPVGLPS